MYLIVLAAGAAVACGVFRLLFTPWGKWVAGAIIVSYPGYYLVQLLPWYVFLGAGMGLFMWFDHDRLWREDQARIAAEQAEKQAKKMRRAA